MEAKFCTGLAGAPQAAEIRREVFIQEQGFQDEFDSLDDQAAHLLLMDGDMAVATARIFPEPGKPGVWHAGRIAVRKQYRGLHLGARLMQELCAYARAHGGNKVYLSAQVRAQGFYERCGFTAYGDHYDDEGCPHVSMEKRLEP